MKASLLCLLAARRPNAEALSHRTPQADPGRGPMRGLPGLNLSVSLHLCSKRRRWSGLRTMHSSPLSALRAAGRGAWLGKVWARVPSWEPRPCPAVTELHKYLSHLSEEEDSVIRLACPGMCQNNTSSAARGVKGGRPSAKIVPGI